MELAVESLVGRCFGVRGLVVKEEEEEEEGAGRLFILFSRRIYLVRGLPDNAVSKWGIISRFWLRRLPIVY